MTKMQKARYKMMSDQDRSRFDQQKKQSQANTLREGEVVSGSGQSASKHESSYSENKSSSGSASHRPAAGPEPEPGTATIVEVNPYLSEMYHPS